MDQIARSLAKLYLNELGYFVSFDVACPSPRDVEPCSRFDIAGVRLVGGKAARGVVGMLRNWWHPQAHLTPSVIRAHLLPGLADDLSDEAIHAFRTFFDLGPVPVDKLLFFSFASPEKAEEAEELLTRHGIQTVYLERVARDIARWPASKAAQADPGSFPLIGLLRQTMRGEEGETASAEDAHETSASETPQLSLNLFVGRELPQVEWVSGNATTAQTESDDG